MKRWSRRPEESNWGDFGDSDQIGRMNLLTPELRREAAREIREGHAFALSLPLNLPGLPLTGFRSPPKLTASEDAHGIQHFNHCAANSDELTCDDRVVMNTQYSTQWDSLAHYGRLFDVDGTGTPVPVYYNGYRPDEHLVGPGTDGSTEARALGIDTLAACAPQGRGVLVDLRTAFGTDPGRVGYDGLMRTIEQQQVDVRKGDFLLLYTGFDRVLIERGPSMDPIELVTTGAAIDGGDAALRRWIIDSGVVAICSDNIAVEWLGRMFEADRISVRLPLHDLCLFQQGIFLGELWYLAELADWLRDNGRTSFMLTAPPLRLPGSVGSPLTPIATV